MKKIAIIPARSGSKGLKDKNIKKLNGIPLMAYSIKAAKNSNLFDEIMVSTDSEDYRQIAREFGAEVPFLRSMENSSDGSSSWDAVKEVLDYYSNQGSNFDIIFLLQPTSPLRDEFDILEAYKLYERKAAKFVVSVSEADVPIQWVNKINSDSKIENFIEDKFYNKPRQELEKYYRINGGIYIIDREFLFKEEYYYTKDSYAYIMDRLKSVDIDDKIDFMLAEAIIRAKKDVI